MTRSESPRQLPSSTTNCSPFYSPPDAEIRLAQFSITAVFLFHTHTPRTWAAAFLFSQVTRANKRSRTVLKHSSSRKKRREPRAPSEDAERVRTHSHRSSANRAAVSRGSNRRLAEGAGGRLRRLPPPLGGLKAPRWKFGHFSKPVSDLGVICHKYMPFKCS